jgi:hypothetical protein
MANHYFIVAGISLTSIQKELKPALPKRRQKESYLVVISATTNSIKIAVAGGAITLPAITSGPFLVELPYRIFEFVLTYPFEKGAVVRFEVAVGSFCVNGMATTSPDIVFKDDAGMPAKPPPSPTTTPPLEPRASQATFPIIADPLDAMVGMPLVTAYVHLRKYGLQPHAASPTFATQQMEVDGLLKKAEKLMHPLGITRADLERLLDRKAGID